MKRTIAAIAATIGLSGCGDANYARNLAPADITITCPAGTMATTLPTIEHGDFFGNSVPNSYQVDCTFPVGQTSVLHRNIAYDPDYEKVTVRRPQPNIVVLKISTSLALKP